MSTTIKPRTACVVIYQGDDLERLAGLRREVDVAERQAEQAAKAPRRGGDEIVSAQGAQDAYDAFVDEAAERAIEIHVTALRRKRFRKLMAEHPPRKVDGEKGKETHPDDEMYEVNVETFGEVFLPLSITAPTFDTPDGLEDFIEELSDGDYERVFSTAYWLNRAPGGDPKATRYSPASLNSDET